MPTSEWFPRRLEELEAGRERKNLLPVSELAKPLSAAEFVNAASFLRKQAGRKKLLVPAAQFQRP